jgi:hypothetical protein
VAPETTEDTPTDPDAVGNSGFVSVGSMEMDCMWCSATLLDDGRVLVVGKRAELYDPDDGNVHTHGSARHRLRPGRLGCGWPMGGCWS